MTTTEILLSIMEEQGVRQKTLANRLAIRENTTRGRIFQTNISIDKLDELLRVLDYKIQIVPSGTRTPKGGYDVETAGKG